MLGQSLSPGWTAKVKGGPSLGEPMLIDGFANGWMVDPAAVGSGSFTVELTWTPQRTVWIAVAVSGVWFLGLLGLVAVGTVRRRRRKATAPNPADDLVEPVVRSPRAADAGASPGARVGAVLALAFLGWFVGGPLVGLAVAVITGLVAWLRRGRLVALVAAAGSLAGVVLLYVGYQVRRRYLPGVEWPSGFGVAHQLVLVAVLTVVADTVVRFAAHRWPDRTSPDAPGDGAATAGSAPPPPVPGSPEPAG